MSTVDSVVIADPVPTILAMIAGEPMTRFPEDLFIPPDALKVFLDSFSGPLDLLCYLIRRQHIDVMNIPIVLITKQYMEYIHLMEDHQLELAAEYLVMAAMLAEIKSRMLLPRTVESEEDEIDPRLSLVRQLQAYEAMRTAANLLDELPRCDRDFTRIQLAYVSIEPVPHYPDVDLASLHDKMLGLIQKQSHLEHHYISKSMLSVRDRMTSILSLLQEKKQINFHETLSFAEGRVGIVVSFLAMLELAKQSLLQITQITAYSPIYLMAIENVYIPDQIDFRSVVD
jgi:segregation and condensation protein A